MPSAPSTRQHMSQARKPQKQKGTAMENKSYFEEMSEQDLTLVGREGLALSYGF